MGKSASCAPDHNWIDRRKAALYRGLRLLVTFPRETSQGNPVRIRDCPAAVSRNQRPDTTGFLQDREDGSVETPDDGSRRAAPAKSEDLPAATPTRRAKRASLRGEVGDDVAGFGASHFIRFPP